VLIGGKLVERQSVRLVADGDAAAGGTP
jgi:hypothetical protein